MRSKHRSSIGILGGSFDPPHKGHLKISNISLKKLKINRIYWIITKKNPFKRKPFLSLNERIKKCKTILKKNKKIELKYLDKKIKSSRTIKLIKYLKTQNGRKKIFLIIGSDNLVNFHKWLQWKKILQFCELVVFSRKGFDQKARKSVTVKYSGNKHIIFIKNRKMDISSTMLRKYYMKKK
tara:strand:- start:1349 stop:1891 length:543 start_codon:yes stop_codon:yes gene_type:complete